MAITIHQQPAVQNYSYNDLVYVISSSLVTPNMLPPVEFSFIVEITEVGTTNVFTYRKQPNPTTRCIININNIVNDNLEWELNALGATTSANAVNQLKAFSIVFKEEYLENDALVVRNATTPITINVIKGVREYNTGLLTGAFTIGPILSAQPDTIRVQRSDSLLITTFSSADTTVTNQFVAIPQVGSTGSVTVGPVGDTKTFALEIYDTKSDLGEVRFWWFNRKGGLDCFTADQEATLNTAVEKRTADSSVITHGFTTSSNREPQNPNVFLAGSVNYGVDFTTTNTKNTRWLNQQEADLVAGLFESPEVFIQVGSDFIPATIINSSYDALLTLRERDLFQYNIMYRFTNDKRNI